MAREKVVFLVHTVVPRNQASSRPEIALSWARSQRSNVRRAGAPVLRAGEFDAETGLMRAAGGALRRAAAELDGSPVALVLTDHTARIVDVQCAARSIRDALDGLGVVPGVRLGEDVIGTNALGTPVETRQGLLVRGAEHYSSAFGRFTCYGHPIFHPVTRRLEGVLGIGGSIDERDRLPIPLARRMVRDIEESLQDGSPRAQTRLMNAFQAAASRRGRCVVVVGEGVVLASPSALDLLEASDHATVRACADSARLDGEHQQLITLASGRRARLVCRPIDRADGVLVDIVAEKHAATAISEFGGPQRDWPLCIVGDGYRTYHRGERSRGLRAGDTGRERYRAVR